jgi:hypothetical protein
LGIGDWGLLILITPDWAHWAQSLRPYSRLLTNL